MLDFLALFKLALFVVQNKLFLGHSFLQLCSYSGLGWMGNVPSKTSLMRHIETGGGEVGRISSQ